LILIAPKIFLLAAANIIISYGLVLDALAVNNDPPAIELTFLKENSSSDRIKTFKPSSISTSYHA
jgi:hypothetical protein